eukprot:6173932-Pleurochrysis_carterae.AAC.1
MRTLVLKSEWLHRETFYKLISKALTPEAAPSKIGAPASDVVLCDNGIPVHHSISHAHEFRSASPYERKPGMAAPASVVLAWRCVT